MPTDFLNFNIFSQKVSLSRNDICREVYRNHRQTIKIKKEKTLSKNLMGIFDAALKISNKKGFNAMTMRDLSRESGLSMGGLYAYFKGKNDLLEMLIHTGQTTTRKVLEEHLEGVVDPVKKLRVAIRTHIFLSEVMLPWFYFSYMEARHLGTTQKQKAIKGALESEQLFAEIIEEGMNRGAFQVENSLLAASVIKAMVQDWYVKRWKYLKRRIGVEQYAGFVIECVERFCQPLPMQK
jgi:AcrR family transcriptional regulator